MERLRASNLHNLFLITVLLLGMVSLYWSVVPKMVADWWHDPNFSHGFLVPVFSGYLIWRRRGVLRAIPAGGSRSPGVVLILLAAVLIVGGKAGGEYFSMRCSIVLAVGGLLYIVFGRAGFRECLFPLAFLFFMIPLPYLFYDAIAFPLKMIASWLGEHSLDLIGIPVFRDGNIISLPNMQMEVADACSGIRSLMTLMTLATAASYIMGLGITAGVILILSGVPISIATNSTRILITGILSNRFGAKAASGFFHEFSGWVIFLLGAFLVLLVGKKLRI